MFPPPPEGPKNVIFGQITAFYNKSHPRQGEMGRGSIGVNLGPKRSKKGRKRRGGNRRVCPRNATSHTQNESGARDSNQTTLEIEGRKCIRFSFFFLAPFPFLLFCCLLQHDTSINLRPLPFSLFCIIVKKKKKTNVILYGFSVPRFPRSFD